MGTTVAKERLIQAAREAMANSYAPYSVYHVGAAVLGSDGNVYSGCNVENASYGLTVCAERTAVVKMVSAGCRRIEGVAVATKDGGTPCGMCLQTILEFAEEPASVLVWCTDEKGGTREYSLKGLLPQGFRLGLK